MQRYESYKPSGIQWVEKVPSHWGVERAKWLFNRMERPVRPEDDVVTAFRDGQVTLRTNRRTEGFTNALQEHGYQGIRKGDLVIHAMDAFAGAIGVSDSDGKSTPVYAACLPRGEYPVNSYYYAYLLRYMAHSGYIESLSKGIRERSTDFRFAEFRELPLPIPDKEEQDRIVAFLDQKTAEIDAAIAKKEQLIEMLLEQKAILINNAVSIGSNLTITRTPGDLPWTGSFSANWELLQLKRVVSTKITDGPHETPNFVDEGVPFVSVEGAFDGRIDLEKRRGFITPKDHARYCQKLKPQKNDIFFVKSGSTTGKTVIVDTEAEFSVWSPLALIRPKPDFFDPQFLLLALQSPYFQRQVQMGWSYGTQPNIGMADLEKLWVIKPSINEQNEILDGLRPRLGKLGEVISLVRRELTELQQWKSTLIAESVTGKIKV